MTQIELKKLLLETGWFEDNIYLNKYIDTILQKLNSTYLEDTIVHYHHIIPRSCWILMQKEIDNSLGVKLKPSEHLIVHHLLGLCTVGELRYKMQSCFIRMTGNKTFTQDIDYTSFEDFNALKAEFSKAISKKHSGRKLTPEHKAKVSQASSARWADPEYKARVRARMQQAADNMTDEQRQNKNAKVSKAKKGTKCDYKTAESNKKISAALKGRIVTDETKQKISKTLQGHVVTEETRQKISFKCKGKVPWNAKPVICIETGIEYKTARFAEESLNLPRDSVYACCKGKRDQINGLHWKYKEK